MKTTKRQKFALLMLCASVFGTPTLAMAQSAPVVAPTAAVEKPVVPSTPPTAPAEPAAVPEGQPLLNGVPASAPSMASAPLPETTKEGPMSLARAVSVGVMTNPEYGNVAASRRATDEELNQAKALYLPSIDFQGDVGFERTDSPSTRATGNDDEVFTRYSSSLTLTQMLFDGWATKYENERQKQRVQSSAHRVTETSELTGLSIVESFLEVMRQRELLAIARENIAEHETIMGMIREGVNAGRSTQADLEQIQSRLAATRAQESSVRQALRNAESSFKRAVGDMPGDLVMPAVPVNALAADVDQEVKQALATSPTLAVRGADVEVAYNEYKGTGSSLYPKFDVQLGARTGKDLGGIEGEDQAASALLVANWNLYRGGGDVARVREFKHRHQQSKEILATAARQIEDDVRQTWAGMISAGERAHEFSGQASNNAEVVRAYKDQFILDRRTLLDVLDAQNELFVSRSNAINAEYLEIFSVFRLLALKGHLMPTLGVSYPRETALLNVSVKPAEK